MVPAKPSPKRSASARFYRRHKDSQREHRYVFALQRQVIVKTVPRTGAPTQTAERFASIEEMLDAFHAACRRAEHDGWTDFSPNGWQSALIEPPKRPSSAVAEKRFEAISAALAHDLGAANGKAAAEKRAIQVALAAYGQLKSELGNPPKEHAVHFFAVDGVGLRRQRKAALLRVKADPATAARWRRLLESAAIEPPPRRRRRRS